MIVDAETGAALAHRAGTPPTTTTPDAPSGASFSAYAWAFARLASGILALVGLMPLLWGLSAGVVTVTWAGQSAWDAALMGWSSNELLGGFALMFLTVAGTATAANAFRDLRRLRA